MLTEDPCHQILHLAAEAAPHTEEAHLQPMLLHGLSLLERLGARQLRVGLLTGLPVVELRHHRQDRRLPERDAVEQPLSRYVEVSLSILLDRHLLGVVAVALEVVYVKGWQVGTLLSEEVRLLTSQPQLTHPYDLLPEALCKALRVDQVVAVDEFKPSPRSGEKFHIRIPGREFIEIRVQDASDDHLTHYT